MGRGIVLALLLAAALSGCGDSDSVSGGDVETPSVPAASPTAALPADGPVLGIGTVLDEGSGPMLCLGSIAFSLPPQCSGPAVADWDWAEHPDAESVNGVTWGDYTMVGAWDGTTFTPSEVRETTPGDRPEEDVTALFDSPCEAPEGGWVPLDPATTTADALSSAHRVAEALPDYAISWGDQSINPHWQETQDLHESGGTPSLEVQQAMNDPAYTILNVGVTDDVAGAEAAVREVWGGPLCVTRFVNTHARLREVAKDLRELPGGLDSGYGSIGNTVEISVIHDDGSIQAWADEEYGEGVVALTSALQPVE